MTANQTKLLAIVGCNVLGSSEPAQKPVSQRVPPEESIRNVCELQDDFSHSSIEYSTVNPVAEEDDPICNPNEINSLKKALDRECKTN